MNGPFAARRAGHAALVLTALTLVGGAPALGQRPRAPGGGAAPTGTAAGAARAPGDSALFAALRWREIGPYRGGRTTAVAGSASRPYEYYMGTTGGGVFKTTDGGITWQPVTDKYFGGTIGSIAVAESKPDVVYVGGGEGPIRGNVSHGDGVWKSADAGKTWTYLGLRDARQIPSILVHPTNPDVVYVGAQGTFWAPNAERGVFKSTDGGKTWRKVLFRGDSAGVADLSMDPKNPNTIYAALWQSYRTAWMLSSGGPRSGVFKSTDGGETWTELTRNPGMPAGLIGKIGVSVSHANPERVYAIIEADSGGVFRSDDGGKTWTRVNDDRRLRQRAWYYTHIHADPRDANTVYALNTGLYRSTDGGKTWRTIAVPHGDNHALWIAPNDPQRMINGNDGGANVSFNGGRSWSEQDFATAQMYHVTTSNEFPYRVCGAQQDNSTICVPSRRSGGITMGDWDILGGCESGYIAIKPDDPDISYAGCYGGALDRHDRKTGLERAVHPWPENPMGHSSEDVRFRMQWTYPIVFSPHDPNTLYVGSNVLFRTTNGGESFDTISPDLTRHDPKTMGPSGGPITKDQTGVETYATLFTVAESPKERGVIWTGSDDGFVQITRDNGRTWTNVTPKDLGDFTRVSLIEASPHDSRVAYVAAHRHQFGDLRPTIWKTADYGRTWARIDRGIAPDEPVRAVREDPERRGLLYAGTERGVWLSADDGASWRPLKLNLPPVPVHDLVVKEGDLVAATHGRSFWILDDLSAIRQMAGTGDWGLGTGNSARVGAARTAGSASPTRPPAAGTRPVPSPHLFKPRDAYRVSWGGGGEGGRGAHPAGRNPPEGATVYYTLARANQDVTLEFVDAKGSVIRSFTSRLDSAGMADSVRSDSVRRARDDSLKALGQPVPQRPEAAMAEEETPDFEEMARRAQRPQRVPNKAGLNLFALNLRHPDAVRFNNMIMWAGNTTGPMVAPGTYSVRLRVGDDVQTQTFAVKKDPRSPATQEDIEAQVAFLLKIRDRLSEANNAVRTVRNVKHQMTDRVAKAPAAQKAPIEQATRSLADRLSAIEGEIYQVRNRSSQDPLNYPIKLNNKIAALAGVVASGDFRPTKQSQDVFEMLSGRLEQQLAALRTALEADLPKLNAQLKAAGLAEIVPSTTEPPAERQVAVGGGEEEMESR